MKKVFAIIMSAMMLVCFMPAMAFAGGEAPAFIAGQTYSSDNWTNNGKFRLEISSGEASAFAEVYDDYSVLGKVVGEKVDSTSVSAKVTMKNVASLGLKDGETRTHEVGFGISKPIKPSLPAFFPHIFGCAEPQSTLYTETNVQPFSGATLNGKVNGCDFTYKVSAVTKETETINGKVTSVYTMTATPNSTDAVRRAWHELTSKVEPTQSSDKTNDSKIEIPKGAYLQIGDQKLLFEENCTVNPSDKTSGGANKAIRDAARLLGPNDGTKELENNVQMYIPKGSVLRVGDSIATLKAGIYIKSNSKAVKGEDLIALKGDPTKPADKQLVSMILAAIKITDSAVADIDVNDLDITILTECYVTVDGKENTYVYGDTFTLPDAGAGYKWVDANKNTVNAGTITVTGDMVLTKESTGSAGVGGGGGFYVPTVQKPEITIIGSGKADLSADGRTATITAAAGHELVSVVLNGKEMGKVEKLTGLKTGDKATITFRAKTDGKVEMDKMIAQKASKLTLMARTAKTAKLNIKVVVKGDLEAITDAGYTVKYKFYRSTKKSAGYKAMLTKKAPTYFNTCGKKGTMYYYKARVMIYDKEGNFVAQTALKQCKYANRLWTK